MGWNKMGIKKIITAVLIATLLPIAGQSNVRPDTSTFNFPTYQTSNGEVYADPSLVDPSVGYAFRDPDGVIHRDGFYYQVDNITGNLIAGNVILDGGFDEGTRYVVAGASYATQAKLDRVQQSINATSWNGQWLPLWNQIATNQYARLLAEPGLSLSDSLNEATAAVSKIYLSAHTHWDDNAWCDTAVTAQILSNFGDDIRYDYCKMASKDTAQFDAVLAPDPNPSTQFGGLFWADHGKI